MLLKSGIYHGIATHDERIIEATKDFATREKIDRDSFEFQMLYGIRRDLQEKLVQRRLAHARVRPLRDASGIHTSCAAWPSARQTRFFIAKNLLRQ